MDFATKPTLSGALTELRPFCEADLPAIDAALTDPECLRLTGSFHTTEEILEHRPDPDKMRAWYLSRHAATDRLDLALIDKASGAWVGEVVFNDVDEGNRSCSFRTLFGPSGRDRGLGTDAIRQFVAYGFDVIGLHRIVLEVYAFNPRARRVYEKVGFRQEGLLREAFSFDGAWVDSIPMAM